MTNGYKRERQGRRLSQNIIGLRSSSVPRQRVSRPRTSASLSGGTTSQSAMSESCCHSDVEAVIIVRHITHAHTRDRRLPAHLSLSLRGKPLTDAAENPLECDRSIYQPTERKLRKDNSG